MEVITIESKAFQELMLKIEQLHSYFRSFAQAKENRENRGNRDNREVWLDSRAVCDRLNISTRTLYRLRKERLIAYSFVRGQYRFKESDVEKIVNERLVVANPETLDEFRQIFQR